ncbi:MAG: PilZ domain-containing protein [Candidatus Omnitrophica bacterium]|nr:PilZ domain-containing protein [Candidatus Omnitrophota bacterium]
MSKLKVSTREIGSVCVFDLEGDPTQESLQEIAWKIQRNIRRHRLQRVILNLQRLPSLDPLGVRKLLAACIRPQKSLIFGASRNVTTFLESTYLPHNVKICQSEKEVAEDLGPFLLEKEKEKTFPMETSKQGSVHPGHEVERRRSKRMHVALPIDFKIFVENGKTPIETRAIATNISEGGLFAEYIDLEAAQKIEALVNPAGLKVSIHVFPSANFPEEYQLDGKINRIELRKKQLGLAVEFQAA